MRKLMKVRRDDRRARPKLKLDMPLLDFRRKKERNCGQRLGDRGLIWLPFDR
jgi:hypothetical protein